MTHVDPKRLTTSAVAALAFLLGCATDDTPAPQPPPKYVMAVYGDSRTGHDVHREVCAALVAAEPDVTFHTGDMVENGFNPADWDTFNEITAELRALAPFYPALGNHEGESPLYFQNFDLPGNEQWYGVKTCGVHCIVLDTNVAFAPGSQQYEWLEAELARPYGRHTLVFFHHPPFSLSRQEETMDHVRTWLVPLFEQAGVAMVFCGHEHNYQRFFYHNIYYIITGGGGAPLYGRVYDDPRCQKFLKIHHYCLLTLQGPQLHLRVYDLNGNVVDEVEVSADEPALAAAGR